MTFITDKEVLKTGLILFRRGDVDHRDWYCRLKVPKEDRYKTVSLKTSDIHEARSRAFDHDADLRFRIKHDVPIFNKPFSDVAQEYVEVQTLRAKMGEITEARVYSIKTIIKAQLNPYVGNSQISHLSQDRWSNYPVWRREHGKGLIREQVSDATIKLEMSIFSAIMNFAIKKGYAPAKAKFEGKPNFKVMRRDAFTLEEYRALHTRGRSWIKATQREWSIWNRTMVYNFVLIMCNTGMRPPEARNLRWCDIAYRKDKDGNDLVVLAVSGKGLSRHLVAPPSVGEYLERIKAISKATKPEDFVFTTDTGESSVTLYSSLVTSLLDFAKVRKGPQGTNRSTYSFRHTYATFRLSEGVDIYFLAQQMGTSVQMIEDHYGHVNAVKHADRVLHGMGSWDTDPPVGAKGPENSKSGKAGSVPPSRSKPRAKPRTKKGK